MKSSLTVCIWHPRGHETIYKYELSKNYIPFLINFLIYVEVFQSDYQIFPTI